MSTEFERLKVWMDANGHDAISLQKALSTRFSLKYVVSGMRHISDGLRCRFRDTFGDSAFAVIFGNDRDEYLARYAAQLAVLRAVTKGHLLPAKTHGCHGCNKQAHSYHHESYAPEDRLCVVPLCRSCHRRHHIGTKRLDFGIVPTSVGLIRIAIAIGSPLGAESQP